MTDPYARTPEGMFDRIMQRIGAVESRLARGTLPKRLQSVGSGTTAERDAIFGDPGPLADRVALANLQVVWYNTDRGWHESYYEVAGLPGLTAAGLNISVAPGWYPIGRGPFWRGTPTAAIFQAAGSYVPGWGGAVRNRGGADWFTYNAVNGAVVCPKAGVYRALWETTIQPGSGTMEFYARVLSVGLSTTLAERPGNTTVLNASVYTQARATIPEWPVFAGQAFLLFGQTGSANIHQGAGVQIRGSLSVEYIGPLFA